MRRFNTWLIAIIAIGGIFYLSSIPGLRVLPVLRQLNVILRGFDSYFVSFAQFLSRHIPVDMGELGPFRTVSDDFYVYARENPAIIEFILRKIAHVVVFFFLTIIIYYLINQYTKKHYTSVIWAFVITFSFAALDEYRQSFVDGRVSSIIDVFINLIGILMATILIVFAIFITKKKPKI